MKIGYMRIAKGNGELSAKLQHDALIAAGVGPNKIYADNPSGEREARPNLACCLRELREGDVLAIWKLDLLGLSAARRNEIVANLTERGVAIIITDPTKKGRANGNHQRRPSGRRGV
jgi:DNA invertase Pin-like site-specific DNA recombinase